MVFDKHPHLLWLENSSAYRLSLSKSGRRRPSARSCRTGKTRGAARGRGGDVFDPLQRDLRLEGLRSHMLYIVVKQPRASSPEDAVPVSTCKGPESLVLITQLLVSPSPGPRAVSRLNVSEHESCILLSRSLRSTARYAVSLIKAPREIAISIR